MNDLSAWEKAFPFRLHETRRAVEAVKSAWDYLAKEELPHFNPRQKEPVLTRVIKDYVEKSVSREMGLLGFWATEPVLNRVDYQTGEIKEERRLDIIYGWNSDLHGFSIKMVFEFKKVNATKRDREHYLLDRGLLRFVDGMYSQGEPLAAMVAIMLAPSEKIIPPITAELLSPDAKEKYRMCSNTAGKHLFEPSEHFGPVAKFDTHHNRPPALAPPHGPIQISHIFLKFEYHPPVKVRASKRSKSKIKS